MTYSDKTVLILSFYNWCNKKGAVRDLFNFVQFLLAENLLDIQSSERLIKKFSKEGIQ